MYAVLIGGPHDGEMIDVDPDQEGIRFGRDNPDAELYYWRQLGTPDGWLQVCFVHHLTVPFFATVPQDKLIAAIMRPWRAEHARVKEDHGQ